MRGINPADLIPMDLFLSAEPIQIDVAYAHSNNLFQQPIYHPEARLWLHKDLAAIVILAARILLWHGAQQNKEIWHIQLKDGLRTTDAQAAMQETAIVKANPHWMEPGEKRLLSPPGLGAHPRAMAVDIIPILADGTLVDMGTQFDEMTSQSARNAMDISAQAQENRALFTKSMNDAAILLDLEIHPLSTEWWDYRFPVAYSNQYAPLSESDLPRKMQLVKQVETNHKDFPDTHFEVLKTELLERINQHIDYL